MNRWKPVLASLACAAMGIAHAQTRGVLDTEIILGTYTDLSGVGASWGTASVNGLRMRFDEENAKGGVNGRKLKLIVEDHGYQVPKAVQAASKLIQRDGVLAMVNALGTPMVLAALPQEARANVPNFFPLSFARSIMEPTQRLFFQTYPTYYSQTRTAVRHFVQKRGRKAVCSLFQDTDYGREVAEGVRDEAKALGMTVAMEASHAPTATDFNASIFKLRDAGCDVVLMGTVIRDTIVPYATARRLGWQADFVGNLTSFDLNIPEAPNRATEGLFVMSAFDAAYPDATSASTRDWAARYVSSFKVRPNIASQMAYINADLLVRGLRGAGKNLTADTLIQEMQRIHDYKDPFGGPVLSFSEQKHTGTSQMLLQVVKDGRWTRAAPAL